MSELPTVKTEVVAGVVIFRDGKFLLVQEKRPDIAGLWNWPAGRVDEGESFEQAAVREAKEEVGYTVTLGHRIGIWQAKPTDAVKHAFAGTIQEGELQFPSDELLDARWFTLDELVAMKDTLRSEWVLGAAELIAKTS